MTSQPHEPSAFARQRPVGPETVTPSEHFSFARPSCAPHLSGAQTTTLTAGPPVAAGAGGSRQAEISQRASAVQSASLAHVPCACWHSHGPPHESTPLQTTCWPFLQTGYVQPQTFGSTEGSLTGGAMVPSASTTGVGHGHW